MHHPSFSGSLLGLPTSQGMPFTFLAGPLALNWSLSWGKVSSWVSTFLTLCCLLDAAATLYADSQSCPSSSDSLLSTKKSPLHCHSDGSQIPQSHLLTLSPTFSSVFHYHFILSPTQLPTPEIRIVSFDSSCLLSSLSNPSSPIDSSS